MIDTSLITSPLASEQPQPSPLVELRGITRRFPGVVANDNISLTIRRGEIHTLLGENGAGKSTLLNILSGMLQPDEGTILIDGKPVIIKSPQAALKFGLGTVYQHFTLVPTLSVVENVMLGGDYGFILERDRAERRLQELLDSFSLAIAPRLEVRYLSTGQQQRVEIIKVLLRGSRVLLLDEPTSVLTPPEVQELFALLRRLTAQGVAVVFITHKLDEALAISGRMTVLRQGRVVGELGPAELAAPDKTPLLRQIIDLMFGNGSTEEGELGSDAPLQLVQRQPMSTKGRFQEPPPSGGTRTREGAQAETPADSQSGPTDTPVPAPPQSSPLGGKNLDLRPGHVVYTLAGVTALDDRGRPAIRDVSLELRAGEIVGIAGVDGNGQKELAEVMAGQRPAVQGQLLFEGADVTHQGPGVVPAGVGYITDDRLGEACVPGLSLAENAVLKVFRYPPFAKGSWLNRPVIEAHARRLIETFKIKAAGASARVETLSGGNIQRLLLARELALNPRVLVCHQPTQGLDFLTAETILRALRQQADAGMVVLLLSAELDDIMAVSDRVGVMTRGRLVALLNRDQADRETVGRLMVASRV